MKEDPKAVFDGPKLETRARASTGTEAEGNSRSTDQRRDVHLGRPGPRAPADRRGCGDRHPERRPRARQCVRRAFRFSESFDFRRRRAPDRRIGHAHRKHRVAAVAELSRSRPRFQDRAPPGLMLRRSLGQTGDKHRVEHMLGKARLRKPGPQVRPVTHRSKAIDRRRILEDFLVRRSATDFLQALGDQGYSRSFRLASLEWPHKS